MVPHSRENNPHGSLLDRLNSFTEVDGRAVEILQDRSDQRYKNGCNIFGRETNSE